MWLQANKKTIYKSRQQSVDPALPTGTHLTLDRPEPQAVFFLSLPGPSTLPPSTYLTTRLRLYFQGWEARGGAGRAQGGRPGAEPALEHGSVANREIS